MTAPTPPDAPPSPLPEGESPGRPPEIPPEQSFIDYPSDFPIKVMGANSPDFEAAMVAIARAHDPTFDATKRIERRVSSSGTYLSLTLTVLATSREQLDAIYRACTSHPLAKYVL